MLEASGHDRRSGVAGSSRSDLRRGGRFVGEQVELSLVEGNLVQDRCRAELVRRDRGRAGGRRGPRRRREATVVLDRGRSDLDPPVPGLVTKTGQLQVRLLAGLLGMAGPVLESERDPLVQLGVEEGLEQLFALGGLGAQDLFELALR